MKVWQGTASGDESERALMQLQGEVALLSRLRHPNILAVYGIVQTESSLLMVMAYGARGSLWDVLKEAAARPSVEEVRSQASAAVAQCLV